MGIKRIVLTILLSAGFAGRLLAADKVAVMNLKALDGVDSFLPSLINELFCAKVPELGDYEVITGAFIDEKINASGSEDLMNCNRTDCYYLIGSGFEARLMVAGTIGMQGMAYVVNLMLLDVPNERVTRKVVRKYDGDQFGIVDELELYLQELFGVLPEQENAQVAEELMIKETAPPAPVYEDSETEESYEDLVSDYAEQDTEIEGTPSLTGDAGASATPRERKVRKRRNASMPRAGESALFAWCEDTDRELTFGSGYSMINLGDYYAFDYLKPGYRNGRIDLTLQVKYNSYEHSAVISDDGEIRADSTVSIIGGGVILGYRLFRLLNGWITVSPGATAGYYKYEVDVEATTMSQIVPGLMIPYVPATINNTYAAFFGGNVMVDIGNRINDTYSLSAYINPQLLWVKDAVFFLDFGLKLGYALK